MSVVTVVSQDVQASSCHQDGLVLAPPLLVWPGHRSVSQGGPGACICVLYVFYFGEILLLDARL